MPTLRSNRPPVLITMGDPSGVGPEVTLKSLASPKVRGLASFLVIGDRFVIERCKKDIGLDIDVPILNLSNVPKGTFSYGKAHASFGSASIQYIDKAIEMLGRREARALVTAPINKVSVRMSQASRDFKGHTEYLARESGTSDYAMMFVGRKLKVALVTRHIALSEVSKNLSVEAVYKTIMLAHKFLKRYFRVKNPKIGVSALNPHAGEAGAFGKEEAKIIIPAVKKASRKIAGVSGPISPDVIFYAALKGKYDCVVSMYHDQALAPFKILYFTSGVNLTIGLPFVRTSPDHGTAFDIAGRGVANPESMIEAMKLAARLASRK